MNRFLLLLSVALLSLQQEAMAQFGEKSMFKEGKAWVIQRNYKGNNPTLQTIKVSRKFPLGGTTYWFLNVGNGTSEPYCCWQTDDGKVYSHDRRETAFHYIEIDMSAEPGDSIGFFWEKIPNSDLWKLAPHPFDSVIKKDTIEVKGVRRVRIQLAHGTWVEGIGYKSRVESATPFETSGSYNTSYDFVACYEDGVLVFDKDDFDAPSVAEIREFTADTSADADGPVDVYNLQGQCIRHRVPRPQALRNLPPAVYIIDGKKFTVN